jgi:uncharacterized membrane protein
MNQPDDPSKYKLGLFYWNPDDLRILVPKRFGVGWTLNFARPLTYVILLAIVIIWFLFVKKKH